MMWSWRQTHASGPDWISSRQRMPGFNSASPVTEARAKILADQESFDAERRTKSQAIKEREAAGAAREADLLENFLALKG